MPRIKVTDYGEASGELGAIYDEILRSRGKLAEVHKIQSLNPQSIRDHMALYKTAMFAASPLSRAEREMMAVIVSSINECRYCIRHHGEALNHFWKNTARVDSLVRERSELSLISDRETALCRYAEAVTRDAGSDETEAALLRMRETGIDDRGILDATLVVSYFNFVNRMVLALGVELEEDAGGYRYD
jgi:uncharacterized peroxidase-related enzyme